MHEAGLEIASMEPMDVPFDQVGQIAPHSVYAHIRKLFLANPGADGIYISGRRLAHDGNSPTARARPGRASRPRDAVPVMGNSKAVAYPAADCRFRPPVGRVALRSPLDGRAGPYKRRII
jgi:hypothetical protein